MPAHPLRWWLLIPLAWTGVCGPAPAQPAKPRMLGVNVEFVHINGLLEPAELASLLAQPALSVEARYAPRRLIEGETSRRVPVMPMGSREIPVMREVTLGAADITASRSGVRFALADRLEGPGDYRLRSVDLLLPLPPGIGRPQPHVRLGLFDGVPSGPDRAAQLRDAQAFELGFVVDRYWRDEASLGVTVLSPGGCGPVHLAMDGRWHFRPRHPLAGLQPVLASMAYEEPRRGSHERVLQLNRPAPAWLEGVALSRHHVTRAKAGAATVEQMAIHGARTGASGCTETIRFDALMADGQPVEVEFTAHRRCGDASTSQEARATWLGDGSLSTYRSRATGAAPVAWSAPMAGLPQCQAASAPPDAAARVLGAQALELLDAFGPR